MRLNCLGISHRTAGPDIRERAGFSAAQVSKALTAARHDARIERMVIVSTCHRTELYCELPPQTTDSATALFHWWCAQTGVGHDEIARHAYALSGVDAARHLFRVAAGLDSVVVGESQIVSQVASALHRSVAVHAASPLLKIAFRGAVHAGERARSAVWGRMQAASLGSAAVDAAAAAARGLADCHVVVVGAGEIAELALQALAPHRPARVTIANRSIDAAAELGAHHRADVRPLEQLPSLLRETDVVIAATRATHTLIDRSAAADALRNRSGRPLIFVDVSLPRNVDVDVRQVNGAQLIGIDDLGAYVRSAHAERRSVAPAVEVIVDEELSILRDRIATRASTGGRRSTSAATAVAL